MKVTWLVPVLAALAAAACLAQEAASKPAVVRFRSVDVYLDVKEVPLAAYQLEFTASPGVKIVGVEGGEHAAFKEAPFYDPKAIQHERVILGAFSTNTVTQLPRGKTRVATIHLQTQGGVAPHYELQVKAAATVDGRKISAQASAEEKQRNEDEKAPREEPAQ